jgi:hypothetical protein
MAEVNLLFGLVDHEGLQHRDLVEERLDVLKDHAGLLPVGREHHDHALLARSQDVAVVAERGDEDGDQRRDPRLAASPSDDEPRLSGGTRGGGVARPVKRWKISTSLGVIASPKRARSTTSQALQLSRGWNQARKRCESWTASTIVSGGTAGRRLTRAPGGARARSTQRVRASDRVRVRAARYGRVRGSSTRSTFEHPVEVRASGRVRAAARWGRVRGSRGVSPTRGVRVCRCPRASVRVISPVKRPFW